MKYYLSSFRIGNEVEKLREMAAGTKKRAALIPNSIDCFPDPERRKNSEQFDLNQLTQAGFSTEVLDLRDFFGKSGQLEERLREFDLLWLRGGNTFVLMQAARLSGFDIILRKFIAEGREMIYGGYSAGICILTPTLRGIELVDDPSQKPYGEEHDTIWEGLGILPYAIAPHYRSDHPESEAVDRVVEYYIENKIPFIALRDGEVHILE